MPEQNYLTQNANGGFTAHGSVAVRMLQSGFNANALRTNEVLRKDEWKLFDDSVIPIGHIPSGR